MKSGTVYYRDIPAGVLVKDDDGYLFRYDPAPYASEILRGYGTELGPGWKAFLQDVVQADQSAESRRRLRRDPEIDFKDGTLRALFLAKLTLRRMGGGKAGRA